MISTVDELRLWSRRQHDAGKRIGFVPTMGALHEGHLSLVRTANERCDVTLVSIFVNPMQFGPNEDFFLYPRLLAQDVELLQMVGSPEVFAPDVTEMYPTGFAANVHIGGVSEPLEGQSRPTHFDGVATVVLKLFLMSGADVAFFGQKDFQQVRVIEKMVADLNIPIEIVVCPIIREPDGLAMSSRNRYLTPNQREQARVLSQCLDQAEKLLVHEGIRDATKLRQTLTERIQTIAEAQPDYISVADPKTLQELDQINPIQTPEVVVLLAVRFGDTRLLDNRLFVVSPREETVSGRLAGIDYGTVRIGVALSDPDRRLASPYETYSRKSRVLDGAYFRRLVAEERIVRFVVGLPLHLSGDLSEKAEEVLRFGCWLNETTGVAVDYFDERYTSVEAERLLRDAGLTDKKRKERRDKLAAQILLSAYIEAGCRGTDEFRGIDDEK